MAKLPLAKLSRRSVFDISSRLAVSFQTGLKFRVALAQRM